MDTKQQADTAPAAHAPQEDDRKGKGMPYGIMDILMTMTLISLAAAIAAPRFSKAAAESRLLEMIDALYVVRSHIEQYRLENDGLLPGQSASGAAVSVDDFKGALTMKRGKAFKNRVRAVPANPFMSGERADDITCVNGVELLPTGEEGTGWWFNAATGQFRACDSRFHSVY